MRTTAVMDLPIERHFPLGPLTWYRVGGVAEAFARPHNAEQLALLLRRCHDAGTPVRIIGKGANLLVPEGTVPGMVIQLSAAAFRRIVIGDRHICAGAGADLARVIMAAVRAGLGGLEVLAGIPASVGGAVRMNAGGRFGQIGPLVEQLTCLDAAGRIVVHPRCDLRFDYRRGHQAEPVILQATFTLQPDDPQRLRRRVREIFDYKKASQPLGARSVGCVFKNPRPDQADGPAGWLIDRAGLKGFAIGGARVSEQHANFIVTGPGATAADVLAVIEHVERVVAERFSVQLQREVVVWETRP